MLKPHSAGVKTSFRAGKRIRVQTTFPDGAELLEEYDAVTQHLECRRWRSTRPLGGMTEWDYEIGDPPPSTQENSSSAVGAPSGLRPSALNPSFHSRDTRKAWEWHIRNLPYPEENFTLQVDTEKQTLVLRTKNKKYFKVFQVPALLRAGVPLERSSAHMSHNGGSTLVISYEKPCPIIEEEREARSSAVRDSDGDGVGAMLGKNKGRDGTVAAPVAGSGGSEGAPECAQS
eukprot:g8772.t1